MEDSGKSETIKDVESFLKKKNVPLTSKVAFWLGKPTGENNLPSKQKMGNKKPQTEFNFQALGIKKREIEEEVNRVGKEIFSSETGKRRWRAKEQTIENIFTGGSSRIQVSFRKEEPTEEEFFHNYPSRGELELIAKDLKQNELEWVAKALNKIEEIKHVGKEIYEKQVMIFLLDKPDYIKKYRLETSGKETNDAERIIARAALLKLLGFQLDHDNQIIGATIVAISDEKEKPGYRYPVQIERKFYQSAKNPNLFLKIQKEDSRNTISLITESLVVCSPSVINLDSLS